MLEAELIKRRVTKGDGKTSKRVNLIISENELVEVESELLLQN